MVQKGLIDLALSLFSLNLHNVQRRDGKEIEDVFIVLTLNKYDAARRDAPKIEKIKKNLIEYKNDIYIKKGIKHKKNIKF